jgi:hypothetical protein
MRVKLLLVLAVVVASVLALPGVANAATIEYQTMYWSHDSWSPSSVDYGTDLVSVVLTADDAVDTNYDSTGVRFTATVSANQARTKVSIERVALSSATHVLFVWSGQRVGPTGIAKVGPSAPWKGPDGCNYRMRINYSVRWANGQLVRYSWLTGWDRDYWVRGC